MRHSVLEPDLVVDALVAASGSGAVTLTIQNVGGAPVADPFRVDLYVDAGLMPTRVNQMWGELAGQGMAWGVMEDVLAPGFPRLLIGHRGQRTARLPMPAARLVLAVPCVEKTGS